MFNFLTTLALAASAAAVPVPVTVETVYGLQMQVNGTWQNLTTISADDSLTKFNLLTSTDEFTPVTHNGTLAGESQTISMLLHGNEPFGLGVLDVGGEPDLYQLVFAEADFAQNQWDISSNGTVTHQLISTDEQFFACDITVDNEHGTYLGFGASSSTGVPPAGCSVTTLRIVPEEDLCED